MGAARMLGLGRSSVLNLAYSGELTKIRFGRRVVYDVTEITELVERRRSASQSAASMGLYRITPPGPDDVA